MKLIHKLKRYYRIAYTMGHYPALSSVLFSDKKIFVYYGFLGDNNYGDELVFEAAKELFAAHHLLPVRHLMPFATRFWLTRNKHKIAGIVVGGGTLLGPLWEAEFFSSVKKLGKPVYVHGTGVHKVIQEVEAWKMMLDNRVYGGVRGPMSLENVAAVKTGMKIGGDAAFAMFSMQKFVNRKDNKNVLINLGTHRTYEGQDFFRKEFNDFIASLIKDGYNIQYLPFHEVDLELGNTLKETFPEITLLKQPVGYNECADLFANCAFAIGERLHFTVMAIMTRSPFVSLNYHKKHEDLLLSLSLQESGLHPSAASSEKMTAAFKARDAFNWDATENQIKAYKKFQFDEAAEFIAVKA